MGATPVMAVNAASSNPNQACPCAPPPTSLVMANKLASTCRLRRLTSSVVGRSVIGVKIGWGNGNVVAIPAIMATVGCVYP